MRHARDGAGLRLQGRRRDRLATRHSAYARQARCDDARPAAADLDGWVLLDRSRSTPTRHIPSRSFPGSTRSVAACNRARAAFFHKPVSSRGARRASRPAFVRRRGSSGCSWSRMIRSRARRIGDLIGDGDVETTTELGRNRADDAVAAGVRLRRARPPLPGMSGFELIEQIKADPARSRGCR